MPWERKRTLIPCISEEWNYNQHKCVKMSADWGPIQGRTSGQLHLSNWKDCFTRKRAGPHCPMSLRGSVMTTIRASVKGFLPRVTTWTGHLQVHMVFEHLWPCDYSWDGKCTACILCPPLSYPWQTSLSNSSFYWRCSWYLFSRNCQQSILFCIFR